MVRKILRLITILSLLVGLLAAPAFGQIGEDSVYIIPVRGTIEPGLANFLERGLREAEEKKVKAIILEIDTPGGRIDAAIDMKNTLLNAKIPVYAFVDSQALSAGVIISIACEKVAMAPGTTIGAAEPRPAEQKIIAAWRSELEATAEARGKNPLIVAGMADQDVVVEGVKAQGKILSLSAKRALELGIADLLVNDRAQLLQELGLEGKEIVEVQPGLAERTARFVTHPYVSPVLLTIGFAGVILEVLTIGWGIAGSLGISSIILFFGGHMLAGFAGYESIIIFALGMVAIAFEAFVTPGFGVAGIVGIALITWSIFLASISSVQALISIIVAFIASIALIIIGIRYLGKPKVWNRLILGSKQENKVGYVAQKVELSKYIGFSGTTVTALRPSGTIEVNGEPIDVVSEGSFIPVGVTVRIVTVDGGRVVVREIK